MTRGQAVRIIRKLLRIIDRRAKLSIVELDFVSEVRAALPGNRGRPRAEISMSDIDNAIAETGSRRAAAERLGVSESTIDRRLRQSKRFSRRVAEELIAHGRTPNKEQE